MVIGAKIAVRVRSFENNGVADILSGQPFQALHDHGEIALAGFLRIGQRRGDGY